MTSIAFPAALGVARMTWSLQRNDMEFRSSFGSQAVEIASPVWVVSFESPPMRDTNSGVWKSLLMTLRGKTKQLELWDIQRPTPIGTMRGNMTLNGDHAQGATTLSIIATGENSKTLLAGDLLGLGSTTTQQVVMVVADATSNGSGIISVTIEPPLRNAFTGGAAVTWDKPKALFRRSESLSSWDYSPGNIVSGFKLDLIEDWRT